MGLERTGEGKALKEMGERYKIWKPNGFIHIGFQKDSDFQLLEISLRSLNWAEYGTFYLS